MSLSRSLTTSRMNKQLRTSRLKSTMLRLSRPLLRWIHQFARCLHHWRESLVSLGQDPFLLESQLPPVKNSFSNASSKLFLGIIHVTNDDDDDGCVPHTPTLVGTRSQHEGNQALVSPAPQAVQSSGQRFHFFGENTDNDHSVPGTRLFLKTNRWTDCLGLSEAVSSTTENNLQEN